MKQILTFLAVAVGALSAMPVGATQWLASSSGSGCNGTSNSCTMTAVIGGQTVNVRAYATTGLNSTGGFLSSSGVQLNYFSGAGFGIDNNNGSDTGEGVAPEHAVDNNQFYDVLVFELPLSGMDLEAFRLGWAHEGTTCGTGCPNGSADVGVYFGGNNLGAGFDFTQACLTGCADATRNITGSSFQDFSMSDVGTGEVSIAGTQSGRYLVMTGMLGGTNDNFKVDSIKASGGNTQTPLPGTLALLGLGLVGLATIRRRAAAV